ncbi:MAG: DUF4981 domain-containing protein [Treponema sp.]|jgi:beta-galactosidase|nr:DUF4981 domain-containing protein [Treponema sp.]
MNNIWENPEIQGINRLPMRSPLIPFSSPGEAIEECAAGPEKIRQSKSTYFKDLNGSWKFKLLQNPGEALQNELKGWDHPSFAVDSWSQITVPGTWTLQGFKDYPHYTNVQMPFDFLPPNVPEKNPTGLYRRTVQIPGEWEGRRIVLHIGSAESCTIVFVNGNEIGISKDTRLPAEFDISPYLEWKKKTCTATIAIEVIRYSDASFVEDQDQWWFGGIHRSLYLYSTEPAFIQDVEALTFLDIKKSDISGIIPLVVTLGYADPKRNTTRCTNDRMDRIKRQIKYTVHELTGIPQNGTKGKCIASGELDGYFDYRRTQNQVRTDIRIKNPALWSSEHPNLFILTVSLFETDNQKQTERHIESVSCTIGFKSVRVVNRELLINEKKVYIHGVNRHEHNEYHAKTLTTDEMVRDIHLLKQYNFNAVRTCHYPDDERWYELCDRYGIYLMDEANIENHAYYDCIPRSDEWTNAYMLRIQRMIRRDKNHASIFCWSLGNESGDGQNQVACQAWIRRVDTTRIVHYEGFIRPERTQGEFTLDSLSRGKGLTDLISPMYPSIDLITQYADTRDDYRPIIMCEYSHAMGNANGSLSDYWEAIESHHGLQGGFIWDWIDQGLAAEVPHGTSGQPRGGKYWKYGGDFGDTPTDYDFCLNGINFPDQTPKPAMEECRTLFAPVRLHAVHPLQGIFEIENRYDFSTLDGLRLSWSVMKNGIPQESDTLKIPETLPGQKAAVVLRKIPSVLQKLNDPDGAEILFHADFVYASDTPWAKAGTVCGSYEFILSAMSGLQFYGPNSGKELLPELQKLAEDFRPQLFRALLENECIKRELPHIYDTPIPSCFLNKPTKEWIETDIAHAETVQISDKIFEIYTGPAALKKQKLAKVTRTMGAVSLKNDTKALRLQFEFDMSDVVSEYPRIGIAAAVSPDYKNVSWYGRGPQECYSDRKKGAFLGLYTKAIRELEVPYIVPQENGTRCDVRYIEISGKSVSPLHIESDNPYAFSILPYTPQELFSKEHMSELAGPSDAAGGRWILSVDAAQRGVGTGACGPDTMEKYRIRPGIYRLDIVLW